MQKPSDYDKKSDEELVILVKEDQEYFLYLMRRYEEKLMRYIRRISNFDHEDSEDLLQEVFIKVYQNINAYDPSLKFSSWVYRICHNHVIDSFRKTKTRPQFAKLDINDDIVANIRSSFDIKKEVDQKFLKEGIKKVFEKMSDKYREVLFLKFIEEKDYGEISDILKKPIGTVSSMLNRAKKQFRDIIEKNGIEL